MSTANDIRIQVKAEYLEDPSEPENDRYVFSYHIRIENHGAQAAKLLSRHWLITDGNQQTQEVRGEGVIGQQPLIPPGGHHEYSSGAVIPTPVGSMRGSYFFIDETGQHFAAPIPVFTLARPRTLN
jgi:ApaG protein